MCISARCFCMWRDVSRGQKKTQISQKSCRKSGCGVCMCIIGCICCMPTLRQRFFFFCCSNLFQTHFARSYIERKTSSSSSSSSTRKCGATLSGCLSRFCAWTPSMRKEDAVCGCQVCGCLCVGVFWYICVWMTVADILFCRKHLGRFKEPKRNTFLRFTSVMPTTEVYAFHVLFLFVCMCVCVYCRHRPCEISVQTQLS